MDNIFFDNTLEKFKNKILYIVIKQEEVIRRLLFNNYTKATTKYNEASLHFHDPPNMYLTITITSNLIDLIMFHHQLSKTQKFTIYLLCHQKLNEISLYKNIIDYLEGFEIIYK